MGLSTVAESRLDSSPLGQTSARLVPRARPLAALRVKKGEIGMIFSIIIPA